MEQHFMRQTGKGVENGEKPVRDGAGFSSRRTEEFAAIPHTDQIGEWARSYMRRIYEGDNRPGFSQSWNYENGITLYALFRVYERTDDHTLIDCICRQLDSLVEEDGSIRTYVLEDYNLDQIQMGRVLLPAFRHTGKEKLRLAAERLALQLGGQPRTEAGSFWHKKIYPFQVWLDGLYMAMPFWCDYAVAWRQPELLNDVCAQLLRAERQARDRTTGLLYHGWDEAREERWAHPVTGCSPHFWSRAMGWYAMALTDVLEVLPVGHPGRGQLIGILHRFISAVCRFQDQLTGLWHQVTDRGAEEGNYLEASGTAMLVYAIAKGIRLQYLSGALHSAALAGYQGLLKQALRYEEDGSFHLGRINQVAGLGGNPYRDGSFRYYTGEPVVEDDPKGVAPFLLASLELEQLTAQTYGARGNLKD